MTCICTCLQAKLSFKAWTSTTKSYQKHSQWSSRGVPCFCSKTRFTQKTGLDATRKNREFWSTALIYTWFFSVVCGAKIWFETEKAISWIGLKVFESVSTKAWRSSGGKPAAYVSKRPVKYHRPAAIRRRPPATGLRPCGGGRLLERFRKQPSPVSFVAQPKKWPKAYVCLLVTMATSGAPPVQIGDEERWEWAVRERMAALDIEVQIQNPWRIVLLASFGCKRLRPTRNSASFFEAHHDVWLGDAEGASRTLSAVQSRNPWYIRLRWAPQRQQERSK